LSLDECIEFLADDELLEVTPENLRIRKRILDRHERGRMTKLAKVETA
jgi:GTP-binding protein